MDQLKVLIRILKTTLVHLPGNNLAKNNLSKEKYKGFAFLGKKNKKRANQISLKETFQFPNDEKSAPKYDFF